jgi:hypothetical protein
MKVGSCEQEMPPPESLVDRRFSPPHGHWLLYRCGSDGQATQGVGITTRNESHGDSTPRDMDSANAAFIASPARCRAGDAWTGACWRVVANDEKLDNKGSAQCVRNHAHTERQYAIQLPPGASFISR